MKRASKNIVFALIVLIMAAAAFTYLAPHLGWRVGCLHSDSMEPQLKVGNLIVARPVAPEAITLGDIIVFHRAAAEDRFICHRVIGVEEHSALCFKTKGDANAAPDPFLVPARDVVGKVCFHAPFLGRTTQFLKTPLGFTFALLVPGLLLTVTCVLNIWRAFTESRTQTSRKDSRDES